MHMHRFGGRCVFGRHVQFFLERVPEHLIAYNTSPILQDLHLSFFLGFLSSFFEYIYFLDDIILYFNRLQNKKCAGCITKLL